MKGEKVAMAALEFWSTVCDEELDVAEQIACNLPGEKITLNIIQQAIPHLVPLLLEVLVRGQTEEDDDSWNLSQASGVCLGLVANLVGDQCVDTVLPFVQQHFGNPDWKYREAAVLAYGSIMEGPSSQKMAPIAQQSFASLVNTMRDQNAAVRDTVAWTLGRIAQFHPTIVPVEDLIPMLLQALSDVPRVSEKICWVIQEIADNCTSQNLVPTLTPDTTPLSKHFGSLAEKLLEVSKRPDASERNLRTSAYNALSVLIARAGNDCLPFLGKLVEEMLNHLNQSFQVMDKECELQSLICGVLMSLTMRLRQQVSPFADNIMEGALKVMTAYQQLKGAQVLHEEALLLVSSLAEVSGSAFGRYMGSFSPHLQVGLTNIDDVKTCSHTISMIGTISCCLGAQMTQYCAPILELLYGHLKNENVDRKIKAAIMPIFGDIALQIGGEFEKFLPPVLAVLQDAANTQIPEEQRTNEESVEYLTGLRINVMEAYQGIIHGLKEGGKQSSFKEHVNLLLMFIIRCSTEGQNSEELMNSTLKVLGDVVMAFQAELVVHLKTDAFAPCIQNLMQFASKGNQATQNDFQRLQQLIQRYG
jgi:importin subunit beta-1